VATWPPVALGLRYDKVNETKKLLSLFGSIWKQTVFAILHCFRHLEVFGSSLFSLFCTVFAIIRVFGSIWKLTVFAILHCFRYEYLEAFGSSLFSLFGSSLFSLFGSSLFSLFCTVLTLKRQISENSQASNCPSWQMLPKQSSVWSQSLCQIKRVCIRTS